MLRHLQTVVAVLFVSAFALAAGTGARGRFSSPSSSAAEVTATARSATGWSSNGVTTTTNEVISATLASAQALFAGGTAIPTNKAYYLNSGTLNKYIWSPTATGIVEIDAFDNTVVVTGDPTSPTLAAFRVTPQNAEPTGANVVGNMYVTSAGVLKICTVAGTPGTWVSVGAQ